MPYSSVIFTGSGVIVGLGVIVGISVADGENVRVTTVAGSSVGVPDRDGKGVGEAMSGWIVWVCTRGLSTGVGAEEHPAVNSARPKSNGTIAGYI
jgi:hypothetical protein